ncbi:DEAD/DEAH box helicase [Streptococcus sciuri]|uniref:DEAD/DEAH box helicase n=1 Tax=Streptococcus sciuri TaxID=2973939 RepID=A0ABT2F5G0_9STRE|nr:DEAD/DEAH box helicase [Streptococcus sciuri]MCS4487423.1 DEAD/DEAH box helicase [Streptococcus sciuri]
MKRFPDSWNILFEEKRITTLTPIQEALFNPISKGQNVLGISPTGTGKTLAYLFPLLLKLQPKKAQQLLILAPNSELAGQLFEVCKTWSNPLGLQAQLFLSGSSQKRQMERLKKEPEILIGTSGRIFDLVKLKKIKMMKVETIVLDEFDDLLNDSQYSFVSKICHYVPREHQMVYISATPKITREALADDTVTIDLSDTMTTPIQHYYVMLDKRYKTTFLRKLSNIPHLKALVFFNSLSELGACEERLQFHQTSAISLASDINVKFRKIILDKFKQGAFSLLLATDLVARGLDIEGLDYVINAELPHDKDNYIHRAGRTGRMQHKGVVITLVTNKAELKQLKKYISVQEIGLKNQSFYFIEK